VSITVDTTNFEKALREALLHTSRELPAVLNGHAIAVITKAAALTPKADKGSIPYKLYADVSNKRGRATPLIYMIINARARKAGQKALNNQAMSVASRKLIARKVAAIGFTAYAGWQNALVAMGGRGFGARGKQRGFDASSAAHGRGRPATVASLIASFSNTAAWIEHTGVGPLQQALDLEEANMLRHMEEKLGAVCKEASR
jgi:hypothetical protein